MPSRCIVTKCRGNYNFGPKVSVFSFPKDPDLKKKWIASIPRQNLQVTNASKVCELHFQPECIEREVSEFDDKTGERLTANLKRVRLKKNAIPTIFINCPKYLSRNLTMRENPEEKRLRRENQHMKTALEDSLNSKRIEDKKYMFSNFTEFLKCLEMNKPSKFWNVIIKDNIVIFLAVDVTHAPYIKCSITVNENLKFSAFLESSELKNIEHILPTQCADIRDLFKLLDYVENLTGNYVPDLGSAMSLSAVQAVQNLKRYFEGQEATIKFLCTQLKLISCDKFKRSYSSDFLIFSTLFYQISPHAYNFLRRSGNFILPHPSVIRKISSSYHASPHYEQNDANFLNYAREKIKGLQSHERTVTLMLDEIHIKAYFDYKAGNIVGMAFDSNDAASSAHVFMIQSLLSDYKDVVHILPVKSISAETLHLIIKKVIVGLENIGFSVICAITDNNAINRKAMSTFCNPPQISIVYPHPSDSKRPLFFIIDSVHIFKCIRNNWLNQHNHDCCMYYPDFDTFRDGVEIKTASFQLLRTIHEMEKSSIVTYNRTLTFKALNPTNLERQNVMLVTKIFNEFVIKSLLELGEKYNLKFYKETAAYIDLIYKWWCVMNTKSPNKGIRLRNTFMNSLTLQPDDENYIFLHKFLEWLDSWKDFGCTTGVLTKETHLALSHTTHAMLEMAEYCIGELGFKYFLCGKVQTDSLEERFGKYRYLAGSQYNVSLRQIFETESKLRLQNSLPLCLKSDKFGIIPVDKFDIPESLDLIEEIVNFNINVTVTPEDLELDENIMPVLTYITGYCVFSVCKHLKCNFCYDQLTVNKELICDVDRYKLISQLNRGALKFPNPTIIIIVHYCYTVVKKLLTSELEKEFLKLKNQRMLVLHVSFENLTDQGVIENLHDCPFGHAVKGIVKKILWAATNIFLKNYVTKKNDTPIVTKVKKRKLEVFKKPTNNVSILSIVPKSN